MSEPREVESPIPHAEEARSWAQKVDDTYPLVLRLLGAVAAVTGMVLVVAGQAAGSAVVGLAGTLITAGISAEALKSKKE